MSDSRPILLVPGDDPPQIQGSAHLERLREHAEVKVFPDRPGSVEESVQRARGYQVIINSRGTVTWREEELRGLPGLKMITTCSIGTDMIDLKTAAEVAALFAFLASDEAPYITGCECVIDGGETAG